MSYAVYTFRTAEGDPIYVGMTNNLRRRISQHANKPWFVGAIVSAETVADRQSAMELEAATVRQLQPTYNKRLKGERQTRQHREPAPVASTGLNAHVASEIRALLARRGLRKTDLARILSVSFPTARARWAGIQPYNLDELECIALALDVPVMTLFPEEAAA